MTSRSNLRGRRVNDRIAVLQKFFFLLTAAASSRTLRAAAARCGLLGRTLENDTKPEVVGAFPMIRVIYAGRARGRRGLCAVRSDRIELSSS